MVGVLLIGAGGFAGAIARYVVDVGVTQRFASFPWGTLVVNVTGCFVLGLVFALLTQRFDPDPTVRMAITVGFIGAYTTFSTFAFETMRLAEDGAILIAVSNVGLSVVVGIIAVSLGTWLGRAL